MKVNSLSTKVLRIPFLLGQKARGTESWGGGKSTRVHMGAQWGDFSVALGGAGVGSG